MQTISIKYNHIHWIITLSFSDFNQARSTKFSKWLEVPIYLANLLIRRVSKQQWRANNARWRATTCNVHRATWTCALTLVVAWVRVWVLARKCTAVRYDCIYMHPISAPASGRVYVSVRLLKPPVPSPIPVPVYLSVSISPSVSVRTQNTPTEEGRRHQARVLESQSQYTQGKKGEIFPKYLLSSLNKMYTIQCFQNWYLISIFNFLFTKS